jgi:hypothetical protein
MEKEGGFVNRPPLLNGSNYDYWKSRMMAFLKSIDSKTWKAVLNGWTHPTYSTKEGTSTGEQKPESEWSKEEDELALGNSKALNALFNGVDANMFRLIKQCTVAKEAWDILSTAHEGTSKVKMTRLQLFTTKFENLKMKEDENIHEFHMNVLDIANTCDALGEKISDAKLVRKILRSLPRRFDMKVTAIEEAQDISTLKLDELIGSLQTFELAIEDRSEKKSKGIALISNTEDEEVQNDDDTEGSIEEAIAFLGKQFNKVLKRMDRRPKTNVKDIPFDISKNTRKPKSDDKPNQSKGIQCHECEGFGHIKPECPTFLKRQKKGLNVSWSDEETEDDTGSESAKHVRAFTSTYASDAESCEDITFDELAETYKALCARSTEVCKTVENQKKIISQLETEKKDLLSTVDDLKEKVALLTSELNNVNKSVKMLNTGTTMLDEILQGGQRVGDMKGIGFGNKSQNKQVLTSQKKRVSPQKKQETHMSGQMSQHPKKHQMSRQKSQHPKEHHKSKSKTKYQSWRCYYCGKIGHIKPICYKLHGYPEKHPKSKGNHMEKKTKQVWRPKEKNTCLIAHTSLKATSGEEWYFDSGCSRHMTGVEKFLEKLKPHSTSSVTFGDGAKGEIRGIGRLTSSAHLKLDDLLLVRGLTANLISISQLCDQGLKVNFTKSECLVSNDKGDVLMKGVRSKDNCYLWVSQEAAYVSTCLNTKLEETKLWHQKLGHLHMKGIKRIISEEAVRGLPKLHVEEGQVCGECQIGKQTRMSHPMSQHLATTKVLELLHMDFMGPMQVESLGGKKYVLVVVDDFSRYTWVQFIREKSETFEIFRDLCVQLQREKGCGVVKIRSDHGKEFENAKFSEFCYSEGINHEFSSPITPQQNGVVERKNRTLQESARVMLHAKNVPLQFWAEAINTACYVHNRVTLRSGTTSTLYELWRGRKPTVKYFHIFGSTCYILADREQRRKLDPKSDKGFFLGYATNSRAYRVFNCRTQTMMESINVIVDDLSTAQVKDVEPNVTTSWQMTEPVEDVEVIESNTEGSDQVEDNSKVNKGPSTRV